MMIHIDPTLYHGAPARTEGRLPRELAVYALLDRLSIAYDRLDHEPTASMEACAGVEQLLGVTICKNLFLCNRQQTQFYLLMMDGAKPFHTKNLSHLWGVSRLSFASPEHMEKLLQISPGAVSVMGLMNDTESRVQLVMDRPVAEREMLGCHPCVNTASLRLRTRDVLERFLPEVGHSPIIVDLPEE